MKCKDLFKIAADKEIVNCLLGWLVIIILILLLWHFGEINKWFPASSPNDGDWIQI